ncbi:MAG: NHLP leader peptide family natural product precursor [Microcystis aeruginosa LG13-03]|nr:NHLP leader peptide family natural product precursor [Microcystis aeruginosa LG13-03]
MTGERNKLIWGEIVARAWRDAAFKQQLLSNPKAVLTEAGMSVPEDVELQVVQDTPTLRHLVLPQRLKKSRQQQQQQRRLKLKLQSSPWLFRFSSLNPDTEGRSGSEQSFSLITLTLNY